MTEQEKYTSNNDNLEFKSNKIQFYPEDIEKMKNMTLQEKNAYKLKLKLLGRFIKL